MKKIAIILLIFLPISASYSQLSVTDFLPEGYVTDGSVNYSSELQSAIDKAGELKTTLLFPPMTYRVDERGLELRSDMTVTLYGAKFLIDKKAAEDGQVFLGRNVTNLNLFGGEIVGERREWPEGVNIRGVYLRGRSQHIRIRDMIIRDISSNGIAVFGDEGQPARDIRVNNVVIENGCNRYGDYLSERVGPEPGSVREDQGLIAFYYVEEFLVQGCRFENSRSDGTHFYRCKNGQIVDNKIYGATMGGYFLETCHNVIGADNIIRDNGSRGTTIERGSINCTLNGNLIINSGREGLWAPDCVGLIISNNIFRYNGRKPNGEKESQRWNANITINQAHDPTHSPTADYLIEGNIFYTDASQLAPIRIDASVSDNITVRNNIFRGENVKVLVEGDSSGKEIIVEQR